MEPHTKEVGVSDLHKVAEPNNDSRTSTTAKSASSLIEIHLPRW
jgi:hypothetical protein